MPAVVGDHLLGGWDSSKAVPLRPHDVFWRLHFFLPASHGARARKAARLLCRRCLSTAAASFQFQFAALHPASGVTVVESGGRRSVSKCELHPRCDAEGGAAVTFQFAASGCRVGGFPGYAATSENVFDVAQEFSSGAAARKDYWSHGGSAAPSPRILPRLPALQPPALTIEAPPGEPAGSRPPVVRAVASFQDLVLVASASSAVDETTSPGSASSSRAPSPLRGSDATPVPDTQRTAGGEQAAGVTEGLLAAHLARTLRVGASSWEDGDQRQSTPDAAAAAAAAASSNAVITKSEELGAQSSQRGAAAARARRRSSFRSPPRHLEMASSAPDGVLDASAVSFLAAPKGDGSGSVDPTDRRRLAIVLVGLPARGKSFTAHKLTRYLTWLGHETRHFNVGKYRRDFVGGKCDADFFAAGNQRAVASRNAVARIAMEDMLAWMERGGQVGIFDATNSTRERRAMLTDVCHNRCKVIFLEVVCTDEALIRRNVLEKVTASPDYAGTDPEAGLADFMRRMKEYEKVYEPLRVSDASVDGADDTPAEAHSFIRVVDIASGAGSMQVSRLQGYLPGRIVYFLLNAQLAFRPIFFCRHGCSEDNVLGKIGGDCSLSSQGKDFSLLLRQFMDSLPAEQRPSAVWTSTLRRTVQTARPLASAWPQVQWRALDEIDAGACDGLTYDEVKQRMPDEFAARNLDKLRYRYPRGESYLDVIQRLEPVIIEIERQRSPVLIIAHQAVLRCLFAYFMSRRVDEVPFLPMPLHTVVQLTPSSYGVQEDWHELMAPE